MAKEIAEEYASSLADLTVNSKPLINMLTILAEENVEHAGVIVETVEKHLEKVNPEVKLPVLYLVDSIIKNVGGAYVQKFSDRIVHIFTRTFKQVDEKIRSQMFKLRETWHDVFPATKLYQLDVKVNLIDPAWPIQAQPVTQPAIHPAASTVPAPLTEDEERMRAALATKEQELLMLQRKKIEMELEHTRRQLEIAEKQAKKLPLSVGVPAIPVVPPIAMVNPQLSLGDASALSLPAKARLGPPVSKPVGTSRIAPVTGALAGARRDPRLLRRVPPAVAPPPPPAAPIAPHVFDIKPLKRKNVITFDVQQDTARVPPRDPRRRDPRVNNDKRGQRKRDDRDAQIDERHRKRDKERLFIEDKPQPPTDKQERFDYMSKYQIPDPKKINKLPPIPKINRDESKDSNINSNNTPSPKKKKETINKKPSKKEIQEKDTISTSSLSSVSSFSSPEKKSSSKRKDKKKEIKERELKEKKIPEELKEESVAFKELKNYHKEHYMRRNREASESPEPVKIETPMELDGPSVPEASKDVDLRVLPAVVKPAAVHKRPSTETVEGNTKKTKLDKFDILFGNEDVDLRQLPELPHEEAATTIPAVAATNIPATSIAATTGIPASVGIAATTGIPASVGIAASTGIPASVGMAATTGIPASVGIAASTGAALSSTGAAKAGPAAAILPATAGIVTTTIPAATTGPPATSGPATSGPAATTTIPEAVPAPELPDRNNVDEKEKENKIVPTAPPSPKKDWHEVKEKVREEDASVKKPSKLDLVRAKLAEATKGKDRLGRPLLFSKSPSVERERRRTISSEDTDLRLENPPEFDAEDHKKTISIIMEQAKQQFTDGQLDKSQYNTLMYQVLQLNEKLKLKEAKQRESLELSKRKLKATVREKSPKSSPNSHNTFGDIDERVTPLYMDTPRDHQGLVQDSDMRMHMMDQLDGHRPSLLPAPRPAGRSMGYPAYPQWGAPAPRPDEYVPRRFRGPSQYYRPRFEPRPRGPVFEPRLPLPPPPKVGMLQGENPLPVYERVHSPPPLGVPLGIPPTDYRVLEYIDQDPVKTIQIDGVPREIRFYGETAIIMLDWDDPREIKFLPGCRRVTFDNKDSIVISFNDPYKQVEIEDHIFDIRFGAPTRELYINRRWYECFFGGQPLSVLIDGKHHLVHLEGPLPQVDIGKVKRTDLVAGKINLIVNATQMSPIYLDAKVQKFMMNGQFYTIRFVDSLRTVLINEEPFKVEFGDLPKPITVGGEKFFIRFSALPRGIKPGMIQIAEMEGVGVPSLPQPVIPFESIHMESPMEVEPPRPPKTPSPDREHQGGLELLASVMPSSVEAPASASAYSVAEPLFHRPETIPGLESAEATSLLGNINVTDLFAKLVATGIVSMPSDKQDKENKPEPESKEDKENKQDKETDKDIEKEEKKEEPKEIEKPKPQEIKAKIRLVDLLRPETLRVAQPGVVARLYGGMQCSGCGVRFPPEHTVQYSQHLDWHFRQNRRERESARRAHSRQWHYDIGDWVQYGEIADWDEREKSWFETVSAEGAEEIVEPEVEPPSVAAGAPAEAYCALCGDRFHQFFNEDQEEWHLKNSVRHEDKNYHPLCFDDYKASLTKDLTSDDVVAIEPAPMEPIEIKDDTMDDTTQSDAESVVEVLDEQRDAPVEIIEEAEEGDEDDVVFKAEPVVQVTVDDDADTDDETALERKERDQAVDFSKVKIKQEPCDPDDEPIITAEEESIQPIPEPIHNTTVLSSIDGNVQLESTPATVPMGGIRINISKTIPSFLSSVPTVPDRDRTTNDREMTFSDISADDEPCPPGEEPELEYTMKDSLKGVALSRLPPVKKGSELSGLCSIM